MWLLDKVKTWFGTESETTLKMVTQQGNGFYGWNGHLYESDIIRSCIRPFYKACGKLHGKHMYDGKAGLQINPDARIRVLLDSPNAVDSGQMLVEKLAIQYMLNNNAFAYIKRNGQGIAQSIHFLNATGVDALYDNAGRLFLRFSLRNGQQMTIAYTDVIHLRQDYYDNDVFGTSQGKALTDLMTIVKTTDDGIVAAIKNGAIIRWLLKFKTPLKPADQKNRIKEFASAFLDSSENSTGVAAVDTMVDAQQINPNDYVPNAMQMDRAVQRLYKLFGVNEHILQSQYTEDEWQAYYESVVEPFAIQLAKELTRKLFTPRELAVGNRIVFETANLQYASMATKLQLVSLVDRGAMTPNEWREVLNLAPIEGGDVPVRRLDTMPITDDTPEGGEENEQSEGKS